MSAFGCKADMARANAKPIHRWACCGEFDPTVPFISRVPNRVPIEKVSKNYVNSTLSAFGGKADMPFCTAYVRFRGESGHRLYMPQRPLTTRSGRSRGKRHCSDHCKKAIH